LNKTSTLLNTYFANMHKYSFEKLDVWIMAKELVKLVYSKTKSFPSSEQFGLTNQIR